MTDNTSPPAPTMRRPRYVWTLVLDDSSQDQILRWVLPTEQACYAKLREHYADSSGGVPSDDGELIDWVTMQAVVYIDRHSIDTDVLITPESDEIG